MAINTNISLTKTQKEYFQRFVNLSVNETPMPQGDGTIRISPFDDYFLSDESVLYQGIWLATDDANRISLTSQIEEQRLEYAIQLAKLNDSSAITAAENTVLITSAGEDALAIQALQASNDELVNEIATLMQDLDV